MAAHAAAGRGSIVTCSALKRAYRNLLREASANVIFIHLTGDPEVLAGRMQRRTGHFMPASLLPSQLRTLEPLEPDECGASLPNNTTPADLAARALAALERLQSAPPPQPELPS
jgi:gluconokinase